MENIEEPHTGNWILTITLTDACLLCFTAWKGYDSHVTLKNAFNINRELGNNKIDGIPISYEKFMSLTIGDLNFIYSMQFMPSS